MTALNTRFTFRSADELDLCARSSDVVASQDGSGFTLKDSVLIADEEARILFRKSEELSRFVWAKKEILLESVEIRWAKLVFFAWEYRGNRHPLSIEVNGHHLAVPPKSRVTNVFLWWVIDLPVPYLRTGVNEIIFRTDSLGFESWSLAVENLSLTNRSAKTYDEGKTWYNDFMGYDDSVRGEYVVRLLVGRHPVSGWVLSPPVDLLRDEQLLAPQLRSLAAHIDMDAIIPPETRITVQARTGPGPDPTADGWTPWQSISPGLAVDSHRYLQWKAILTSGHPLATPILRAVDIHCSAASQSVSSRPLC